MSKLIPHNGKTVDEASLDVFLRNPVNDSVHPDDATNLPLPRSVTDNFQRWAVAIIRNMTAQVRNLKNIIIAKDKTIAKRDEEIANLKFRLVEAESRADRDGLTGLFNQGYFNRYLHDIHQDNLPDSDQRQHRGDMLVIVDLDGLKAVNDKFGHNAGDLYISKAAERLKNTIRTGDIVARLGGDEFGMIISGADELGAETVAEKITESFNDLGFEFSDRKILVRASVGFSKIDWTKTAVENIAAADAAMYANKQAKGDTRLTLNVV